MIRKWMDGWWNDFRAHERITQEKMHINQIIRLPFLNSFEANFVKSLSSGSANHSQMGIRENKLSCIIWGEVFELRIKWCSCLPLSVRRPRWRRSCPRKRGRRKRCSLPRMTSTSCWPGWSWLTAEGEISHTTTLSWHVLLQVLPCVFTCQMGSTYIH